LGSPSFKNFKTHFHATHHAYLSNDVIAEIYHKIRKLFRQKSQFSNRTPS